MYIYIYIFIYVYIYTYKFSHIFQLSLERFAARDPLACLSPCEEGLGIVHFLRFVREILGSSCPKLRSSLVMADIAIENGPFIVDLPMNHGDFPRLIVVNSG